MNFIEKIRQQPKKRIVIAILLAMVLLIGGSALWDWFWANRVFQGYTEGEFVYVASPLAGKLEELYVKRGQGVKAGDALFCLEHQFESDGVKDAEAAFVLAEANFKRAEMMLKGKSISQQDYDEAEKQFKSAKQQLAQSKWQLDQKTQSADTDAEVYDTFYVQGEWVGAGKSVVALLPAKNIKVRFFVSEKILGKMELGRKVVITADGLKEKIHGEISYISPKAEYTPPIIYSRESRAKLVFMIEASLPENEAVYLHPGQPVEVEIKN